MKQFVVQEALESGDRLRQMKMQKHNAEEKKTQVLRVKDCKEGEFESLDHDLMRV